MVDRIADIEKRIDIQSTAITRLEMRMEAHDRRTTELEGTLRETTVALQKHTAALAEYNGARRAIHWLVTIGLAIAGWFVGKGASQ